MARRKKNNALMDAALAYLTPKARTVREMELHLDSCYFGEVEVYECVERLKELGYLDDARYAADFIESRLRTRPVSRRKLHEQLYNHKLPESIIDKALEAITDEMERENAAQTAAKYWRQFENLEDFDRKTRVMRRLMGRGYDFEAIRQSVEAIIGSLDAIDPAELGGGEEEE